MSPTDIADLLGHSAISIAERYGIMTPERSREALARKQLFTTLIEVETRARADRLAGYCAYLAATVHQASPLLLDLCRHEQLDLDAIAWRIPSADPWPTWLRNRNWLSVLHRARERDAWRTGGFLRLVSGNLALFVQAPLVVRERGDPKGALAVRVLNGCLEVIAKLGTTTLRTRAGLAELMISTSIPETLRLALRGMPLDDVIDHPSLGGRGYVVDSATKRRSGRTVIRSRAEPVPWTMPWARSHLDYCSASGEIADDHPLLRARNQDNRAKSMVCTPTGNSEARADQGLASSPYCW